MRVQDFTFDGDAVLNVLYLHWDVNNNSDKYDDWQNFLSEHSYMYIADVLKEIPERTKKFAILFSLYERRMKSEGRMWNEGDMTDYESAIAAMSNIMSRKGCSHNDVRFCDVCGMPMCEGYMLDPYETSGGYYCCEEHARRGMTIDEYALYTDNEWLFYTEWEGSGDSDDIELIN